MSVHLSVALSLFAMWGIWALMRYFRAVFVGALWSGSWMTCDVDQKKLALCLFSRPPICQSLLVFLSLPLPLSISPSCSLLSLTYYPYDTQTLSLPLSFFFSSSLALSLSSLFPSLSFPPVYLYSTPPLWCECRRDILSVFIGWIW